MLRRQFLSGCAATLILGISKKVMASESKYAMLIDIDACDGCGECVRVCHERTANLVTVPHLLKEWDKPLRSNWSQPERRAVQERLTPYNWLTIQHIPITTAKGVRVFHVPRQCMHCLYPSCVYMCPTGALTQNERGAVYVLSELCIGCGLCIRYCPWRIPHLQLGTATSKFKLKQWSGSMWKCDLCHNLPSPLCLAVCSKQVRQFGEYALIRDKAHTMAEERGGCVFGESENGGTSTFYVSAEPLYKFEIGLLNNQLIGSGLPTFRVQNAQRPNFKQLIYAPLGGVLLAGFRLWRQKHGQEQR
ncbi:MAG: 4Fe-4S dicluster domain-containing protein [Desulfovibrio sp.]|nr:4Fe-4S dicluster domain-containing protein [Desulfovibrio sp.]